MNFAKTPAAVAHAWLIQSKLPNHPGSRAAGKPIKFLPASVRDSDLNRKVICPDGWAKSYGNPDATPIDTSDTLSCDEFAYASSCNSGGMPASLDGMNEVDTGNDCVQTYASRIATGDRRLETVRRHPYRCSDVEGSLRTLVDVELPEHPVDAAILGNVLLAIEVPSAGQGRILGGLP
ncbi:hypothetical protein [Streptomyces noursei]|uniref:hypothetical protein n=1 Tax=Streptomyces noursei TaxID=1971 RepID=UPI0023B85890|nr:hypothetical protein [Streptomyces noursei]